MLPKTLAGFLLLSGLIMFIGSLLKMRGVLTVKGIAFDPPGPKLRVLLGSMGIIFMLLSGFLYYKAMSSGDDLELLAPMAPSEEVR